ncbi:uncharacterized protein METZ01_LOCUS500015, partial [marine metagenome]
RVGWARPRPCRSRPPGCRRGRHRPRHPGLRRGTGPLVGRRLHRRWCRGTTPGHGSHACCRPHGGRRRDRRCGRLRLAQPLDRQRREALRRRGPQARRCRTGRTPGQLGRDPRARGHGPCGARRCARRPLGRGGRCVGRSRCPGRSRSRRRLCQRCHVDRRPHRSRTPGRRCHRAQRRPRRLQHQRGLRIDAPRGAATGGGRRRGRCRPGIRRRWRPGRRRRRRWSPSRRRPPPG